MIVGHNLEEITKWLVLNEKGEGVLVDNAPDDIKEKHKKLRAIYDKYSKNGIKL